MPDDFGGEPWEVWLTGFGCLVLALVIIGALFVAVRLVKFFWGLEF